MINISSGHNNRKGFTLAETLITLVIIGIVAALTVPTLINKHRKTEVETRLKSAYSILANMFKAAEVDNGTLGELDFGELAGQVDSANTTRDILIDKYMLPYLKVARDKTQTYQEFGYKKISAPDNPSGGINVAGSSRFITLVNGITFWITTDKTTLNNGKKVVNRVYIYTDIDGPKRGPNTLGKDIFIFEQPSVKGYPLTMFGEHKSMICSYSGNKSAAEIQSVADTNRCTFVISLDTGVMIFTDYKQTREQIMSYCQNGGTQCGALIRRDGWRIADDYPWL